MKNDFIKIEGLTKVYKSGEERVYATNDVNLSIEKGEMVTILGPSGSGKSTLLNIIGGIDNADEGKIFVGDREITLLDSKKLLEYRRECVGFVFQFYNLVPNLTVYENVEIVADISKSPFNVDELLKNLGIHELAKRYPVELSGGQQQRAAIARAIVKNPTLLLCDEPTGALDFKSSIEILNLLKEINKKYNTTVLIITHNSSISKMCDRVIKISDGKIIENSKNSEVVSPEEIEW